MGRQSRPVRVFQNAKSKLASRVLPDVVRTPPMWMKAIESIPPGELFTRPCAIQHSEPDPLARKPRKVYRPTKIVYPEDALRKDFYKDHPWELARPRMIVEWDGKDARYRDWSKGLRQLGMPLCGESVVQRQLWLMQTEGKTKEAAYDEVRREFYRMRQEEHVERRIAVEEARMVGAYFNKNVLQIGMDVEDMQYERWKRWALQKSMTQDAWRAQGATTYGEEAGEGDVDVDGQFQVRPEEALAPTT